MQMIEIKRFQTKVGSGGTAALDFWNGLHIMSAMQTLLRWTLGLATLVLALTFSAMLFAVVAVGGTMLFGWYWWKTRHLRRELKARQGAASASTASGGGHVYEGEVIREVDLHIEHRQPTQSEKTDRQEVA